MKTQKIKSNSKYFLFILGFVLISILCVGLLMLSSRGYFAEKEKPMLSEDVAFLCEELETNNNLICISNREVYPKDFSTLISEKFETPSTTYQDFQNIFIRFQTKLRVETDPNVIISTYDLNKDGKYDLMPYFDGTLDDNIIRFILFKESFD